MNLCYTRKHNYLETQLTIHIISSKMCYLYWLKSLKVWPGLGHTDRLEFIWAISHLCFNLENPWLRGSVRLLAISSPGCRSLIWNGPTIRTDHQPIPLCNFLSGRRAFTSFTWERQYYALNSPGFSENPQAQRPTCYAPNFCDKA